MEYTESDYDLAKHIFISGAESIFNDEYYIKLFGIFKIKVHYKQSYINEWAWNCHGYKYAEQVAVNRVKQTQGVDN